MSAHDEKALIISNFIFLIAGIVAFLRIFIYYFNNDLGYTAISLVSSVLFFSLFILNTKGFYDIAKFGLIIVGSLATGYKELQSGGHGGQIYLIMASFGVNFLFFSTKEPKKLIAANLITFANLFTVVFFPNILNNSNPISFAEKKDIIIGVFSNISITVLIIWYFVKKSSDIELKLIEANNQLVDYNKDILIKNEQIEERNIELNDLYEDLVKQKNLIEIKNEEIFASIRYAERIQTAFLPSNLNSLKYIEDSFLLFKPKDIVSGDFYWWAETPESTFLCVADCTGHGVPGAMLSMLGMVALNDAVLVLGIKDLDLILEYIDNYFVEHIKKDNNNLRDGVELSIIKIENNSKKIYYSGAKRPIFVFDGEKLREYKPSKRYIGERDPGNKEFQNIEISYEKQLKIYLFTDGFTDQGNWNSKKIGKKRLREDLSDMSNKDMAYQKEYLLNLFEEHKGKEIQRDDSTIIGLQII